MADKGINIKDKAFILYSTPPKVGKSVYSYIDQIDYLVKENKELKDRIGNAISYVDDCIKEWIHDDYDVTMYNSLDQEECDKLLKILKGEWDKE